MINWRLAIVIIVWLVAGRAAAHPASQSRLYLSVDQQQVGVTLHLPADQLEKALPDVKTWQTLKHFEREKFELYLADHLQLFSAGRALKLTLGDTHFRTLDDETFVAAQLALAMPPGETVSSLTLYNDIIQHYVINHRTLVFLQNDMALGHIDAEPVLIDILRYGHNQIDIPRANHGPWHGFVRIIYHGIHHILEGSDHLAFLLSLLMVTGLRARRRTWQSHPATIGDAFRLVTSFAIGHSVTLAINALLPMPDYLMWVEAAVAGSVLLGGVNVLFPLFAGRDNLLAMLFGLIHGMAFASALSVDGLQMSSQLIVLFGFNLGIEIIQVLLVLMLLPCINLWRKSRAFTALRWVTGLIVAAFGALWLTQRIAPQWITGEHTFTLNAGHTLAVIAAVIALSTVKYWRKKQRCEKANERSLSLTRMPLQ